MIIIKKIMLFFIFLSLTILLGFSEKNKKIIFIDPGHGGVDKGACVNGVKESDLNLEISFHLKEIFESNGYDVLLTRDDDYDLSTDPLHRKKTDFDNRINMINSSDCLLYLSIHQNIYTNEIFYGAQTFYNKYNLISKSLATNIQVNFNNNFDNKRKAKAISGIYLIDKITKPGVLIECGFMSNQKELNLLQDKNYQKSLANSIYTSTLYYLLTL